MAYGATVLELTLDNYFKDGRRERQLLWQGDPVFEMLYDSMKQLKDGGKTFSFDVKYGTKAAYSSGDEGRFAIGSGNTYARGADARANIVGMWEENDIDLNALVSEGQIMSYIEDEVFGEMVGAQEHLAAQLLTGATPNEPRGAFGGFMTLHGGDGGTAVTYTALDGVARNGLLYHDTKANQIAAGITRHGISSAEATTWVNQYVDNTGGSWAADTQVENAQQLFQACSRGARSFSGGSVKYKSPTMGICSSAGYFKYLKYLRGQVRYVKGADDGSDTMQNVMGGALFEANCPLYYSYSIDDALTTQFSGYGGVLWFIYGPAFLLRYVNRNGYKGQKGRVWQSRPIPKEAFPDQNRQVFRFESEQQGTCLHLPSQGCMKGWNQP